MIAVSIPQITQLMASNVCSVYISSDHSNVSWDFGCADRAHSIQCISNNTVSIGYIVLISLCVLQSNNTKITNFNELS